MGSTLSKQQHTKRPFLYKDSLDKFFYDISHGRTPESYADEVTTTSVLGSDAEEWCWDQLDTASKNRRKNERHFYSLWNCTSLGNLYFMKCFGPTTEVKLEAQLEYNLFVD